MKARPEIERAGDFNLTFRRCSGFFSMVIFLILAISLLYCEEKTVDELYDEAATLYSEGRTEQAIERLEHILKKDPEHPRAKVLLPLCLYEVGSKLYARRNYKKAARYFKRLLDFYPDDAEIKQLYEACLRFIAPKREKARREIRKDETMEMVKNLQIALDKQRELIEKHANLGVETLKRLRDMELMLAELQKRRHGIHPSLLLILFASSTFFIVLFMSRSYAKQRKLIQEEYKKILPKLGISPEEIKSVSGSLGVSRKLSLIESISKELPSRAHYRNIAIELLQEFMKSNEPEVKAKVAHTMYRYSPERCFALIDEMLKDLNYEVRLAAIRGVSELLSPTIITKIIELKDDPHMEVRREVIREVHKYVEKNQEILDKRTLRKLKNFLNEMIEKHHWIIG